MTSIAASPGRPSTTLHYAVGEISGKLDQMMVLLLPRLTELEANHATLDERVGTVEIRLARMAGGGAVIVFLISAYEVIRYVIPHLF